MKKIVLVLITLLLPISVFATSDKEEIYNALNDIKNIQVDDNIVIKKTTIKDNTIELTTLKNGNLETKTIDYLKEPDKISFASGTLTMPIDEEQRDNIQITDNDYAFYIYSIIENKANTPYEENNYYNSKNLKRIVSLLSEKETNSILNHSTKSLNYYDSTETFGVTLEVIDFDNNNINFKIIYHFNYASGNKVMKRDIASNTIDKNPATRNYSLEVTLMLFIVMALGAYTIYSPKEKGSK